MKEKQTFRVLCVLLLTLMISAVGIRVTAADYPDQIMLDNMADLFEGVAFDHELHADLGEDCAVCHHHTTGTGTTDERCVRCHADSPETANVACQDCHVAAPFSAQQINQDALDLYQYHVDKPGLKAAYHWNCMGCHEAMDGPTGCQDCHVRTAAGDAFYHADATPSAESHESH
jgi:hypothetical protein